MKINFEKGYDKVRWEFQEEVMSTKKNSSISGLI